MSAILVTGGAGFIGSNFVRHWLARRASEPVVVLDKLTYAGHRVNLPAAAAAPLLRFLEGDIADRRVVDRLFAEHRPWAVVNFAAESHVDRSIDSPRAFVETNIRGTFELLDAARVYGRGLTGDERTRFRFLHVSTDEVFGSLGLEGAFTETTPYAPNSPYAASKAAADHLVRAYHHTFGLPTLLTNCSNNYGPYQFPEKLVPLVVLNALDGRPLPIYGDGMHRRDWLHVEDHCDGLATVLERGRPGESYNIGASDERPNVEVVDAICAALDVLVPAATNPALPRNVRSYAALKTFVPDRPGHDRRYAIDASKIRAELGWAPRVAFSDGLAATVRWYVEHRDWCVTVQRNASYQRERLGLRSE